MGKRYFCDYCNRAFQDNLNARKKHLHSSLHIRNKEEWYSKFKGKKQILEENLAKRPCNRFLSTGTCPFGDQCKYRHIRNEDIERMKAEAETTVPELPPTQDLMKKWHRKHFHSQGENKDEELSEESILDDPVVFALPPELQSSISLPASLLPPPTGGWEYSCDDLAEWG
ncbi:unnamed protein product [Clavelina lepadiformis]|uniref:C3H1-type domain-containing protein n=1 Tax=Clavelina lepadiformis TaxID=159417 RepID=A0ABP0FPS0_CLALP